MKNFFTILFCVYLVFFFNSCGKGTYFLSEEEVDQIYEVDYGQCGTRFNHKNVISSHSETTIDDSIALERMFTIDGIEYNLRYQYTKNYPLSGGIAHYYAIKDDDEKIISFDEDGMINSILFKYKFLNISKQASPEYVLEVIKIELEDMFELSNYEYVDVPTDPQSNTGFGSYYYLFYNKRNGYMTNHIKIWIDDDGGVSGVVVESLSINDFNLDVNQSLENEAIELKLKNTYTTDFSKYRSYEHAFPPYVVLLDGKSYIQYFVSCEYYDFEKNSIQKTNIIGLLIPIDLISNE